MPQLCNCKRDFVREGRCCCVQCDIERKYDEYYLADHNIQTSPQVEPIRPPQRTWRAPSLRKKDDES